MLIEYWPIIGYGLNLQDINNLLKNDVKKDLLDLTINITANNEIIDYASTGDMYDDKRVYLLCNAILPWEIKYRDSLFYITKENVENKIIEMLKPYLKRGIDINQIREKIDYISDVGC